MKTKMTNNLLIKQKRINGLSCLSTIGTIKKKLIDVKIQWNNL